MAGERIKKELSKKLDTKVKQMAPIGDTLGNIKKAVTSKKLRDQ